MKIKGPNIRKKDQLTICKSPKSILQNIFMREQKLGVDIRAKRDIYIYIHIYIYIYNMVVITLVKNKNTCIK